MADRYLVSLSGKTWNGTNTNLWSTTSGGTSGASAPTSSDNVIWDTNSGSGTLIIASGAACANLTIGNTAVKTDTISLSANFSPSGNVSITGNSAVNRILIASNTLGTQRTITLGASATFKTNSGNFDLRDIAVTGGAANELDWTTGSPPGTIGDCQGNSGITFTTALQGANALVWQGKTASTTYSTATAANWLSGSTSRVPLPQDDIDYGVAYGSTVHINQDMPRMGRDITWANTTYTGTKPEWHLTTTSTVYGSFILSTNMTMLVANQGIVMEAGSAISFDTKNVNLGNPLTIQCRNRIDVNSDVTNQYAIYYYAGELHTNNYTIKSATFSTKTSTLTNKYFYGGSSNFNTTYSAASSTTIVDLSVVTGITFDLSSTTWTMNAGASGYSYTYAFNTVAVGNIVLPAADSNTAIFSGNFTFNNITMASAGTKNVKFTGGSNVTTTGTQFLAGSASGNITITSTTTTQFTLTKNSGANIRTNYVTMSYSKFATSGTVKAYAGLNSTDSGNNSNWTWGNGDTSNAIMFGDMF